MQASFQASLSAGIFLNFPSLQKIYTFAFRKKSLGEFFFVLSGINFLVHFSCRNYKKSEYAKKLIDS